MHYTEIGQCRICGSSNLELVIDLGEQALAGMFPLPGEHVPLTPVQLVRCKGDCGLVQLNHNYNSTEMYGDNYGYRSGLNQSMIDHLESICWTILDQLQPSTGDTILDIASNDGTLLGFYKDSGYTNLIGIDPTIKKFKSYYKEGIKTVEDFFSKESFFKVSEGKKARVITSLAVLYDLQDPQSFVQDISECLEDKGVWVFEQSYLPLMIKSNAFDTLCQEHLTYLGLSQIKYLLDKSGLYITDAELTNTNGGSIIVWASKTRLKEPEHISYLLEVEKEMQDDYYDLFRSKVLGHNEAVYSLLESLNERGKTVLGLGASTKGNVLLQAAGITNNLLQAIAEVNEYKFGRLTPGTDIPIISEQEAQKLTPDYYFVMPWHFRDNIIKRFTNFLEQGGKLIFPLPNLEIVSKNSL